MTLISVGLGGYLQIIHAQRWQHLEQIPQVTDGIRLPEYKILRRTDCHPDDEQHCGDRHKPAHLLLHDPMTDGEPPGSEQADIDKAAQIGKQHRVEAAPAHNSEAICQYHGKYNNAACFVLRRLKWRKVMPRSRHPQKASEEEIAASKKLKPLSKS